ncbi:hypothetical protein GXP67_01445 [Rhodocytophaga rosea]|uniref:Uncharacterized protein n=1 Tax=Rhodocytophaga rosea TaxID=2704465 RepID=A0A6C0GC81_9BACT|nr:hypothetical protein [Rhodocytophaga rosea]QHT65432.1 hypothetical protein GXP67_01445 [Rhodocytophaga rosea]
MKQREVTDENNVTWTCVQPLSGTEGKTAQKAEEILKSENGGIPVVCTPSGGAQSVRLALNENWDEQVSDEELLICIQAQQGKQSQNQERK